MSSDLVVQSFLKGAAAWLCDGYSLDLRYIARETQAGYEVWDAAIGLSPGPPATVDMSFQVSAESFAIGQIQRVEPDKARLLKLLEQWATACVIAVPGKTLTLAAEQSHYFESTNQRDLWFLGLDLRITGTHRQLPSAVELMATDCALRLSQPPFDGLSDAARWLGLNAPGATTNPPRINIFVQPPADLGLAQCSLANDRLHLTLLAHVNFDVQAIRLALRVVPGNGLASARRHVADAVDWNDGVDGVRTGTVSIQVENADSVLVMLLVSSRTVRRHWFVDPQKGPNNRLLATQCFDSNLRMLRDSVFEASDSRKFEHGIASLLFLLGFNPACQLEQDAPDLIVATPAGRLVIVECTLRIGDFASKLGKLVDRRGTLSRAMSKYPWPIVAVLICRMPLDQVALQVDDVRAHNVLLVTAEEISNWFGSLPIPRDPDAMLREAIETFGRDMNSNQDDTS